MKRFFAAGTAFLLACPVVAQSPQFSVGTSGADSIPQTTIVPVQQPPVRVVERTTVYEEPERGMDRAQRRAYRAKVYAAKIDSLVQSRNYMFFPNSMQEIPGGMIRSIYADYFFFGMFVDHVEVHLPTERGVTQYVEMLNFDSMSIRDYRAARTQWGGRSRSTLPTRRCPVPRRFRRLDRHGRNGADASDARRHDALCRMAVEQTGQ
ncbi:MAG: hypothetical protein ACLSH3_07845 [Alistipes finegoldii]